MYNIKKKENNDDEEHEDNHEDRYEGGHQTGERQGIARHCDGIRMKSKVKDLLSFFPVHTITVLHNTPGHVAYFDLSHWSYRCASIKRQIDLVKGG